MTGFTDKGYKRPARAKAAKQRGGGGDVIQEIENLERGRDGEYEAHRKRRVASVADRYAKFGLTPAT